MPRANGTSPRGAREAVTLSIAVVVTVVWAIATIVQVVDPERTVPSYANLIMATVVGALFGTAWVQARKRESERESSREDIEL